MGREIKLNFGRNKLGRITFSLKFIYFLYLKVYLLPDTTQPWMFSIIGVKVMLVLWSYCFRHHPFTISPPSKRL